MNLLSRNVAELSACRVRVVALLSFCLVLSGCDRSDRSSHPNIIVFLVDDMGWQDTSVPFWHEKTAFNHRYRTPHMERLAAEGMKFTQAYATAVCSPTRISLMTGMNAVRHRVTNWTLHPHQLQPMEDRHEVLSYPLWNVNGLTTDRTDSLGVYATPLPAILRDAGYHTIHVGKAHFGAISMSGADPLNLGFQVNIAGHAAGAPASYYGDDHFGHLTTPEGSPWPVPGLSEYHDQEINLTEVLTREALAALDHHREADPGPFFLYLAHYTVHTPIMADRRYVQSYLDAGLDTIEAKYASMIEGMDQSLGDVMDYLDRHGLSEETIILFMSDNGGLSVHARGGTPNTHNYPLASGKGSIMEGGIREPMLVRWPGVTMPGSVNDNYLIIEDFFSTILEMAGIGDYQTIQEVDGVSFVPMLKNPASHVQDRPLYWHYPNEWGPEGPGIGAYSAIRRGDWKLVYYHEDQRIQLFNIRDDISEEHDLFGMEGTMALELARQLGTYLRDHEAQMPVYRATGQVVPWPDQRW